MMKSEAVLGGTLDGNGVVILDTTPNLVPGRVTVRLETEREDHNDGNWFDRMMSARRELERSGCPLLDDEAIRSRIAELRHDDD